MQNHMNASLPEVLGGNQRITTTPSVGNSLESLVASSGGLATSQQSIIQQLAGPAATTPVSQSQAPASRASHINGQASAHDLNVNIF